MDRPISLGKEKLLKEKSVERLIFLLRSFRESRKAGKNDQESQKGV